MLENVTSATGLDVDSSGSLFVSQLNARRLLKVSLLEPAGVIGDGEITSLPLRLSAVPNPFTTSARFLLDGTTVGATTIQIYDTAGRLIREMTSEVWSSGSVSVAWDGRDQHGRVTSAGLYYVEARGPGGRVTVPVKLVRLSR